MGKSIERLNIADFCEQYVGHNTTVYLYTEEYKKNEEGMLSHYLYKLWRGMDWQINFSKYDEFYFETHPTVEKCPYREYKVVKVINAIDGFADEVLKIALVVEKKSDDEKKIENENTAKETEMIKSELPKESWQCRKEKEDE